MPVHTVDVRPVARDALVTLASLIRERRLELGWSQDHTAQRLRISPTTYRALERGSGSVAIATVFNAATLVGVPLFGEDASGLATLAENRQRIDALLPRRSVTERLVVNDDF